MNIKAYIDYFDEISHLKREQQFVLLEQAYNEACVNSSLFKLSAAAYFVPVIFVLLFAGGSYLVFGYIRWILVVSVIFALLLSRIVVTEINTRTLLNSLKHILARKLA